MTLTVLFREDEPVLQIFLETASHNNTLNNILTLISLHIFSAYHSKWYEIISFEIFFKYMYDSEKKHSCYNSDLLRLPTPFLIR